MGVAILSPSTVGGALLPASVLEETLGFSAETGVPEFGVVAHSAAGGGYPLPEAHGVLVCC